MQEIVLILSSIAGVATASALKKIPKEKNQLLSLGASSHIKSQINSLKIEKDILTKTISRLYENDSEFTKIQKDKLLLKYQHQLGIVLAKLEKLDQASKHPDLGPVGDGLITLMDQKLSKLDDRLYELSSKISTKSSETKKVENKLSTIEIKKEVKQISDSFKSTFNFDKPIESKPVTIPATKPRQSFELTTLTNFSSKEPKFPSFETNEISSIKIMPKPKIVPTEIKQKEDIIEDVIQNKPENNDKLEIVQQIETKIENNDEKRITPTIETKPDITKEVAKISERKALPEPKQVTIPIEEELDDVDELEKIKGDIMKVLSKLDQAEVE